MCRRPYDILTIGDMCVDLIVAMGGTEPCFGQVEQWVPGYTLEMGGSCCLYACQTAKLGLRAAILGRVGDDAFGHLVLRRLRECGVDTRHVGVEPSLQTGLGLALAREDGDRATLTCAGSLNAVYPADVTDDLLRSARHLHYGSYYLQTHLLSEAPRVLERAKSLGLSTSLDTNWDPAGTWEGGLSEALAHTDLFLPNEQEALAITGEATVEDALDSLVRLVPVVAIKCGERGALVGWRPDGAGPERHMVPVEPVPRCADTVGAGDSYDAGFVTGWLAGLPLEVCAALGNRCGRATTLECGGLRGQLTVRDCPELAMASG